MRKTCFRTLSAALPALLVAGLAGRAVAAGPFPDKNLEEAVRAVLQDPKGDLTDAKLSADVFILETTKEVRNLAGLEKCKNLAQLKAPKGQVADLTPLKGLTNLQSLDLSGNKITDLAPLAGLTRLQYLELSNNQIAKVDPLAKMASLASLYLTGNKISDIGP